MKKTTTGTTTKMTTRTKKTIIKEGQFYGRQIRRKLGEISIRYFSPSKRLSSISSNTADARLSNVINYATGMVEHYIGQEV